VWLCIIARSASSAFCGAPQNAEFEREIIKKRVRKGLAHARANGRIGGGRYVLSPEQQAEAKRLILEEKKSQGFVAEKYGVDRSTISRMMTEIRLKEELNGRILSQSRKRAFPAQTHVARQGIAHIYN
jgi:DNA invertase Pin-like site-specific DNA recombinase